MDNTQHTYFAELKLALQKAGCTVQPVEDSLLPIEWNGRRLCQVTESGGIRFRTDDITAPEAEMARGRVTDIAGVVREYMTLIEQAPDLKADGLGENYKLLAEFNGAVLAGHPDRYGVEFVTWEWSYGRTGLWQGHWLNVYANYDMNSSQVCDELEIALHRGDGSETALSYSLNAAEKEVLLRKMEDYCQEQTGMGLAEYSAQIMAEAPEPPTGPAM